MHSWPLNQVLDFPLCPSLGYSDMYGPISWCQLHSLQNRDQHTRRLSLWVHSVLSVPPILPSSVSLAPTNIHHNDIIALTNDVSLDYSTSWDTDLIYLQPWYTLPWLSPHNEDYASTKTIFSTNSAMYYWSRTVGLVSCPDHNSHEEKSLVNQVELLGPITTMW